jgi:signal transduction histidine kinase
MSFIRKVLNYLKVHGLMFGSVFVVSVLISATVLVIEGRELISSSLKLVELSVLRSMEIHHHVLQNARWPSMRLEYLMQAHPHQMNQNIRLIEPQVSQLVYGSDIEFILLRSMSGHTRVEVRHGLLVRNPSEFQLEGEEEFQKQYYGTYHRPCRFGGNLFLCVANIQNTREFVNIREKNYSVIGISPTDIILAAKYGLQEHRFFLPSLEMVIYLGEHSFPITTNSGDRSLLSSRLEIDKNFNLGAGFPFRRFVFCVLGLSLIVTLILLGCVAIISRLNRRRNQTKIELSMMRQALEHYDHVQKLIRGVIHDVKSPISALKMALSLDEVTDKNDLIGHATQRLQLTIEDLQQKGKLNHSGEWPVIPIKAVIKLLIEEKRIEYGPSIVLSLETDLDGLEEYWVRAPYSDFMRMVSNLLNNSFDALGSDRRIVVSCKRTSESHVMVVIKDFGKGIPPERLTSIFNLGATFGKSKGSGYGLFQAKHLIGLMDGEIWLESQIGIGTSVQMRFLIKDIPSWAVRNIKVNSGTTIYVVDDEESVFHNWERRTKQYGLSLVWIEHTRKIPLELIEQRNSIFLVDNNFNNDRGAGQKFLEENPKIRAIWVTSEWHIKAVQDGAKALGLYLLGKEFINQIEFKTETLEQSSSKKF